MQNSPVGEPGPLARRVAGSVPSNESRVAVYRYGFDFNEVLYRLLVGILLLLVTSAVLLLLV